MLAPSRDILEAAVHVIESLQRAIAKFLSKKFSLTFSCEVRSVPVSRAIRSKVAPLLLIFSIDEILELKYHTPRSRRFASYLDEEESTGQRRAPAYAVDRGIVHRLLNTPPVLVLFKMPQKYALLWHIRPTAAAGGVRHSTVDPSIACAQS